MLKIWTLSLFLLQTLFAENITIAVAANLSYAIEEIKAEFVKDNPAFKLQIVMGSSGKLTAQIRNGAPYGVFMSANMKYPLALYKDKLLVSEPRVYAKGEIAYMSVTPRDFTKGIGLLENENIRRIAIANPKTAPYGNAAEEAIKNAGVYKNIKPKLIFAESISQTVSYVLTAADLGIVAKSALFSSKMKQYKEDIHWKSVDPRLYTPIKQGIALLKYSEHSEGYKLFYDFIFSAKASAILRSYGYAI